MTTVFDLGDGYDCMIGAVTEPKEPTVVTIDICEPGNGAGCWVTPTTAREIATALNAAADEAEK